MKADMRMWTIYNSPKDYPGRFVARMWVILDGQPDPVPTSALLTADTLEAIRGALPPGLVCLTRYAQDDSVIVETWL